jgi:hypothetical protein
MNGDKHYNLTVTDDNGKSLTTTNVSTKHPDEIVRLMTLAGLAQVQAVPVQPEPESDCGCGGSVEMVDSVEEAEYEPTGPQEFDLDDFSKKTADSISRQKKRIQPSRGDNPLSYSIDENDIFESLMDEFNKLEEAKNAYAIGMAAAEKQTGDKPPLKKSTINKAHKIAKAVQKNESAQKKSEKLDELSPETMTNYIDKASGARGHRKLPLNKVDNRYAGVHRASTKLDRISRGLKKGDFVTYNGKLYRIFGFTGSMVDVGEYYGDDSYGGTKKIHLTHVKKAEPPKTEMTEGPLLGPKGDIHRAASAEQSDREYIEQRQFKDKWKKENPNKPWPGYEKAGFKSSYYKR